MRVKENNIIDKLVDEEIDRRKTPFRYITMEELLREEEKNKFLKLMDLNLEKPVGTIEEEKEDMGEEDLFTVGLLGDVETIESVIKRHENLRRRYSTETV